MTGFLLRDVTVAGRRTDVRLAEGIIAEIGPGLTGHGAEVVDGRGRDLIPGLHDHHLHLMATAAAGTSVRVGPEEAEDPAGFAAVLRGADARLPEGGWLRAVGYDESVAGPLDRDAIDAVVAGRPVRIQHRSGALWYLNGAACREAGLDGGGLPPGAETDAAGRPNGRLWREDAWLRDRLPAGPAPDLRGLGRRLALLGVTGVTDATPYERPADLLALAGAGLPQRVVATGGPALAGAVFPPGLGRGPVKVVVADHEPPPFEGLAAAIAAAHEAGRSVAVHCVTAAGLALTLAAGLRPGDRIEHGSVIPPEAVPVLARRGVTVVTQPGFVAAHGDRYLRETGPADRADLYRCGSLLAGGVAVAGSTDAPYGPCDPWRAMRAAAGRRTAGGRLLGGGERIGARAALDLFLAPLDDPGGPPRTVRAGAPADLVLLAAPLAEVLARPSAEAVAAVFAQGVLFAPGT
ncbi:amidohydrolase family protein [Actinocorallia longicatena]|uniref:Amidohydrolase family protein n=1 Tax=Actinocorallia longicatena TaxID=111803 RepID=A0ABP6Q502_9ACTN